MNEDELRAELIAAVRTWWISHGQIPRSTTGHIEHLVDHAVLPTIRTHETPSPARSTVYPPKEYHPCPQS